MSLSPIPTLISIVLTFVIGPSGSWPIKLLIWNVELTAYIAFHRLVPLPDGHLAEALAGLAYASLFGVVGYSLIVASGIFVIRSIRSVKTT